MEQENHPQQIVEEVLSSAKTKQGQLEDRLNAIGRLKNICAGLEPQVQPILERLIGLSNDEDPEIRAAVAGALMGVGIGAVGLAYPNRAFELKPEEEQRANEMAKHLLGLSNDPDKKVRQNALDKIGMFAKAGIMEDEIRNRCWQVFEDEEELRNLAGFELVTMGEKDKRLIPGLIDRLNSEDSYERFKGIWGLGEIGDESVLVNLEDLKAKSDDPIEIDNIEKAYDKIKEGVGHGRT